MQLKTFLMIAACATIGVTEVVDASEGGWIRTNGSASRRPDAKVLGQAAPDLPVSIVVVLKLRHETAGVETSRRHALPDGDLPGDGEAGVSQGTRVAAPSAADARGVMDYLRSEGFTDIEDAPNHLVVSANGTVGIAQRAFHTTIVRLSHSDGSEITNLTVPMVPSYLTQVDQVLGLDSSQRAHTLTHH
ncbi:protease pro-enzyme activation domain-containing protein [Luteibacter sp. CQ10]|uniref:protease pro-enzyme activation domain-containing protein n=1 Tax=Luteibacter sp. CQ10 TaxID=2805821 RepID=UPI0034A5C19C